MVLSVVGPKKAEQNKTEQNRTKQNNTKQYKNTFIIINKSKEKISFC